MAVPGWRPQFFDYLYLGFTNVTAFSPTDVMPLARWAKAAMTMQAAGSLLILGLVIARAVNILRKPSLVLPHPAGGWQRPARRADCGIGR